MFANRFKRLNDGLYDVSMNYVDRWDSLNLHFIIIYLILSDLLAHKILIKIDIVKIHIKNEW